MIITTRQIILGLFFLNGILIGIVSNVYSDGATNGKLIGFKKIVASMREIERFYLTVFRFKCWLGITSRNSRRFLHGFITNLSFKKRTEPVLAQ